MSNLLLYFALGLTTVAAAFVLAATVIRRARREAATSPPLRPTEPELPTPFAGIEVAATAITSLQPDDVVVVCELDALAVLRRIEGEDAVESLQVLLARHLGNRLLDDEVVARVEGDAFVVVQRAVQELVDRLVRRIIETWAVEHPAHRLHIGAARHTPRSSPLDTAESARAALFAARRH